MLTNINNVKVYTLEEVQGFLKVSEKTLRSYIKDGRLKAVKIGRRWTVTEENLTKFVNGVGQA